MRTKMPMAQLAETPPKKMQRGKDDCGHEAKDEEDDAPDEESTRMAMKRLPIPASGNSMATSSGVSMLS